ncbi:MAG: hypothetical protein FWC55_00325 [Firmicutes bacterium]|nr:hypothetical protein [Bacillota bacterium]
MSKKRKLLISMTAALTAVALVAGVTYAWFTAKSPVAEHVYASGSLKIAYSEAPSIYSFDTDPASPNFGWPLKDIVDPATGTWAMPPIYERWAGMEPSSVYGMYPDVANGEPPLQVTYRNAGTLDAFVRLSGAPSIDVLERAPLAGSADASIYYYREQPDDSNVLGTAPNYVPDTTIPGYQDQLDGASADAGMPVTSLVGCNSLIDPDSVLSWIEAGLDADTLGGGSGQPGSDIAVATKAQLYIDDTGADPNIYALMPGNVNYKAVPIVQEVGLDWQTNAKYIDNWYNNGASDVMDDTLPDGSFQPYVDPVTGVPYPGTKVNFGTGFLATQFDEQAIKDILKVNLSPDLMPAYVTPASWGVAPSGWMPDNQVHSLIFILCHWHLYGLNETMLTPRQRLAPAQIRANLQRIALANGAPFVDLAGYIDVLNAARAK